MATTRQPADPPPDPFSDPPAVPAGSPDPRREIEFLLQTNESLLNAVAELVALKDVSRRLMVARTIEEVVDIFCASINQVLHGAYYQIFLRDVESEEWRSVRSSSPGGTHRWKRLPVTGDVVKWIARHDKQTTVPIKKESLLTIVPLSTGRDLVGLLCIDASRHEEHLSQLTIDRLNLLAVHSAAAIYNATLDARLRRQLSEMEHTRNFLENILESISHGIFTLDESNRITQINRNATAMLGIEDVDVIGRAYPDVFSGDLAKVLNGIVQETIDHGFAMEQQWIQQLSQGVEVPLAISTAILRDEDRRTRGVIVLLRDMTASRELERLRKLDQMKSEFVSNVSHELRTPLTSIKAYTEALADMAQDEQQKEFLKVIDEESNRLLALIEDLLSLSRIESGRLRLRPEPAHLGQLVQDIMGVAKVQSDKHQIAVDIASDLPLTMLDPDRIKEVLINLISNAIKYSPAGGLVTVKICKEEGVLRIDISDQGIGIAEEHLGKIFDQFYRVDSSLTAQVSGTGLGLAIVKSMVEAHSGTIRVASTPGKGSTFSVFLPIRPITAPRSTDEAPY
ncbi:MAG: PAS domain S-box protein [Planctomycetes bacterium]|nr:PAS domain S-box protein [Planctomycetota bacterium]